MHHVRHLKDLNPKLDLIDKLMASRHRKQIPLCRECHLRRHHRPLNLKGNQLKSIRSYSTVRSYHYYSLKRKGKNLVIYSKRPMALIVYDQKVNNVKAGGYSGFLFELFVWTILVVSSLFYLVNLSEDELEPKEFEPIDICLNNFESEIEDRNITFGDYNSSVITEEAIVIDTDRIYDDVIVHNMAINLESFIQNGRINILSPDIMDDYSSLCTEIVNRMQQGDNITIVSSSTFSEDHRVSDSSIISPRNVDTTDPGVRRWMVAKISEELW